MLEIGLEGLLMPTRGKSVILESGKRGLHQSGKGAVFAEDGSCATCCGCEPRVLGSFTTNSSNPVWNLASYQGDHKATPNSYWRLIEVGVCYPTGYPWYGAGCVNGSGRLVGLPSEFRSRYPYNGYMQLQIGCPDLENPNFIIWPGNCQNRTSRYPC